MVNVIPADGFRPVRKDGRQKRTSEWDAICSLSTGFVPLPGSGSKSLELLRARVRDAFEHRQKRAKTKAGTVNDIPGIYFEVVP